jgi:O-antigen/teichoic acid export membrane protein
MARELGPETFGLFGIAMIVFGVADMAVGGAAVDVLVPRKAFEDGYTDATFRASLLLACAAAAGIAWGATLPARWAGDVRAAEALSALAWLLPVAVGSRVPMTLLARELRFRSIAQITALATILSCACGIALALHGAGLWSLVAMEAVRASVVLVGAWWTLGWRPGLRARPQHLAELAQAWRRTLATYSVGYADQMLPRLLVAHLLGPQGLGLFNLALRIPQELGRLLLDPLYDVAMSACARARNTGEDLQRLIVGLYASARLVVWPLCLLMAAVLPWLVPLVFGPQWAPAIVPAQVLLLGCLRWATGSFNTAILFGTGHPRSSLALFAFGCLLQLLLFPLLAPWGIVGVAAAMVARQVLDWPLAGVLIRRATGLPIRRQLGGSLRLLACAGLAALVAWGAAQALAAQQSSWALIAAASISGGLAYVAALRILAPATLERASQLLRAFVRRDKRRIEALFAQA